MSNFLKRCTPANMTRLSFAEENGSLMIDLPHDGDGEVEVLHGDVEVIITVKGGKIVNIELLLERKLAEELSRQLRSR